MMIPENYTGLVLFSASWAAEPCQSARQIIQTALSQRGPSESLSLLEIEESTESETVFDSMDIEAVPCLVKLREGIEEGRVSGSDSKAILSMISQAWVESKAKAKSNVIDVSPEGLQALVSRSKLMLFIKGTPSEPKCGFTGQLIRLLSTIGLNPDRHYATFNILQDDSVRVALKDWAQWPTYPQVYWKGELLGGLDILKEMVAGGQMDAIISELQE